jgi:hypothetical protein
MIALAMLVDGCGAARRANPPPASVVVATGTSTAAVAVAPGQPVVHVAAFRSPGATIACLLSSRAVRCAVAHPAWAPATPCPSAAEQVLALSRGGRPQLQCGAPGAPALTPALKALPYGTVTLADGFACESYVGGVQCGQQGGGHGFFISRPYRRLF